MGDSPGSDSVLGYDREAEVAALGSMLRNQAAIDDVARLVTAEDFYTDAHQKVFAAVLALHQDGKKADVVTVGSQLQRQGHAEDVGGRTYLHELWKAATTPGNATQYAGIVRECSLRRRLAAAGARIADGARNPAVPAAEAVELAEKEILALAEAAVANDEADAAVAVGEMFDAIDAAHAPGGNKGGLTTGLVDLDRKLGDLEPGSLVLVAARPSLGKTSFGCTIALNLALNDHPVFFASLEQSRVELMMRMTCSQAGVDSSVLKKGMCDKGGLGRMREQGERIRQSPLVIGHAARQTVLTIAAAARRMQRRKGLSCLVIDYLQFIEPEDRRVQRYEQVGGVSRRLKQMAKQLAVPVVCMAQLNRAPEDRPGGRPRLSDLRESGSLEMDSDTVVLLHRDRDQELLPVQKIEAIIAKQRNGPTGDVTLAYRRQFTRFENFSDLPPFAD